MSRQQKPIHVMMLGLRGFPDVQGGVETHVQHLGIELLQSHITLSVIVRAPYMRHYPQDNWKGIRFYRVWSPKSKGLEAIVHSFLGVLLAAVKRPDILHIQAIGPAIVAPLARLLGLRVVVTHHGPDYDRQKWGRFATAILRLGERFGVKSANRTIVISQTIQDLVRHKYGVETVKIPNGVNLPELAATTSALAQFDLQPQRYFLMVTRLVPEKRHLDAIAAFRAAAVPGWKLVIVGRSDHPDGYTRQVLDAAEQQDGVVMAGFQSGLALAELYSHAGLFLLPSSHEGLPIALLEALSFGLPVLASNIPPHTELELGQDRYFALGDSVEMAQRMVDWSQRPLSPGQRQAVRAWVAERYHWPRIAQATAAVYTAVCGGRQGGG